MRSRLSLVRPVLTVLKTAKAIKLAMTLAGLILYGCSSGSNGGGGFTVTNSPSLCGTSTTTSSSGSTTSSSSGSTSGSTCGGNPDLSYQTQQPLDDIAKSVSAINDAKTSAGEKEASGGVASTSSAATAGTGTIGTTPDSSTTAGQATPDSGGGSLAASNPLASGALSNSGNSGLSGASGAGFSGMGSTATSAALPSSKTAEMAAVNGAGGVYSGGGGGSAGAGGGMQGGGFLGGFGGGNSPAAANSQPMAFKGAIDPATGKPAAGSDDPEDYFTRLSSADNIFKVVERRYQHTTMNWAIDASTPGVRAPAKK